MAAPLVSVAPESKTRLKRLGLNPSDLARFYQIGGTRWNNTADGDIDPVFAAEAWDFLLAKALIRAELAGSRDSRHDFYALGEWSDALCMGRERKPTWEMATANVAVMAGLSMDFAVWLSRLSDFEMSNHGGSLLHEMLTLGRTEPFILPDASNHAEYAILPIIVDGVYTERFLRAWGSSDTRALDFYRAGIVDQSLIERCIARGVEPDLAASVAV